MYDSLDQHASYLRVKPGNPPPIILTNLNYYNSKKYHDVSNFGFFRRHPR